MPGTYISLLIHRVIKTERTHQEVAIHKDGKQIVVLGDLNSTAALMLDKRKSIVALLRIAAVVLGGLAPSSPHDHANRIGSVPLGRRREQRGRAENVNVSVI